jgi:predicted MPP superfamily phosphohydrolase
MNLVVPAALLGLGVAVAGYSGVENRAFRLRRAQVPVLPTGAEPLRVLHISDLHITPGQAWKANWVRALADLEPDLVVNTGDNLAHPDAVPMALQGLSALLEFPGVFVLGSNDLYAPRWKNPASYLLGNRSRRLTGKRLPWSALRDGMCAAGWVDVTNRRLPMRVRDLRLDVGGVGDPHIWADRYGRITGPVEPAVDLALGVLHAPEPRVLDRFARDGFRLVLAGHTHGGQLRLPPFGALVTNCGLENARARGLSRWTADTWLHVSAGLGSSPYAPVRFACPPEATLLTLVPR